MMRLEKKGTEDNMPIKTSKLFYVEFKNIWRKILTTHLRTYIVSYAGILT